MRLLFADDTPQDKRGPYRVIRVGGRWYVVARGLFYQVDSSHEGVQLVRQLEVSQAEPGRRASQI